MKKNEHRPNQMLLSTAAFSMVEVLVTLAIFGLVSHGIYGVYTNWIQSKIVAANKQDALDQMNQVSAKLRADLSKAVQLEAGGGTFLRQCDAWFDKAAYDAISRLVVQPPDICAALAPMPTPITDGFILVAKFTDQTSVTYKTQCAASLGFNSGLTGCPSNEAAYAVSCGGAQRPTLVREVHDVGGLVTATRIFPLRSIEVGNSNGVTAMSICVNVSNVNSPEIDVTISASVLISKIPPTPNVYKINVPITIKGFVDAHVTQ